MKFNFKSILLILAAVFVIKLILMLLTSSTDEEKAKLNTQQSYEEEFLKNYRIYNPPLPDTFDFAGENVPLETFTVYEAFEKEVLKNSYWHSNMFLLFKRAYRFFPVIEPILAENNIPDDFKYLAVIESGLENAVSPAGARGYWQIMKTTAREYGLEVSSEVDERYHIEKSTEATCKYLQDAYDKFGNWTMAAASYNMGMGGAKNRLDDQKTDSYYDLVLNSETSRYVFRILAVKYIFENPEKAGFYLREKDMYQPWVYTTVEVDTAINSWVDFAKSYNLSYKVFKELNPWLRKYYLKNPYKKTYDIKIPDSIMMNYSRMKEGESDKIGIFGKQ